MPRYRVHLVVDRAFRACEWQLPLNEPVWIVETAANRPYVTESTKTRPGRDHLTGVTAFNDAPDSTPEELAERMLSIIDMHHGEYSANPPYDALHVIGARKSADFVAAAGAFGLSEVSGRDFDFELRIPEPVVGPL
jgi:hypothetical protein